jgi:hypothetical protein
MANLTGEDRKKFLRERLEEQRHFLRKSIREFASGDLAEAVRMATAVRVLVYETGKSKPLLKQLNSNYLELEIRDRAPTKQPDPPPGARSIICDVCPREHEDYGQWGLFESGPRY